MVDAERLLAVLGRVTSRLAVLDAYAAEDRDQLLADEVRLGHLKYTSQTAIEACLDAAHHVVAAQGLGTPASNVEVFGLLGRAGVIPEDLAASLADSAELRTMLIYAAADVDARLVVDHLAHLPALRGYVSAMTALLADD